MRKLVEDGVRHPRWRGSDRSIRTLINTVYIRSLILGESSFIEEDIRYDLEWLLDRLIDYLSFDESLIIKDFNVGRIQQIKCTAFIWDCSMVKFLAMES